MFDQPTIFRRGAGQKAWNVDEGDDRNRKTVAEAYEPRRLAAGVRIEHACQHHRLVGDEADGAALDTAEAGDDVFRKILLDLEEVTLVGNFKDQLLDVVGFV